MRSIFDTQSQLLRQLPEVLAGAQNVLQQQYLCNATLDQRLISRCTKLQVLQDKNLRPEGSASLVEADPHR